MLNAVGSFRLSALRLGRDVACVSCPVSWPLAVCICVETCVLPALTTLPGSANVRPARRVCVSACCVRQLSRSSRRSELIEARNRPLTDDSSDLGSYRPDVSLPSPSPITTTTTTTVFFHTFTSHSGLDRYRANVAPADLYAIAPIVTVSWHSGG